MRGITEFITEHEERLKKSSITEDFLSYHLQQILFLQHERLVHLVVMLFVMFSFLLFLFLFLFFNNILILAVFLLCLVLTVFYVFHYFKLENTLIRWYFIYNEHSNSFKESECSNQDKLNSSKNVIEKSGLL